MKTLKQEAAENNGELWFRVEEAGPKRGKLRSGDRLCVDTIREREDGNLVVACFKSPADGSELFFLKRFVSGKLLPFVETSNKPAFDVDDGDEDSEGWKIVGVVVDRWRPESLL